MSAIDLLPNQNQVVPVVLAAGGRRPPRNASRPGRLIDRLIWQDVDSSTLSTAQLAAIGHWVASGGRLIVVGGSTLPGALDAFPDHLLPFRPSATIEVALASLAGLLGDAPVPMRRTCPSSVATSSPGDHWRSSLPGRSPPNARSGSGVVTRHRLDPSTDWIADAAVPEPFWRRLVPQRSSQSLNLTQ